MPKEKFKLDLEKLKSVLETKEFKTKAYTGTLLSIEKKFELLSKLFKKINNHELSEQASKADTREKKLFLFNKLQKLMPDF